MDSNEFEGDEESAVIVDKHGLSAMTGLTPKEIDAATREGMPVHGERSRGKAIRYSVPACVQWLLERAGDSIVTAKRRQMEATARKREAEAGRLESSLVDIETVEAAIRDGVAAWRSELLSVPARVPPEARTAVEIELRAVINRLAVEVPRDTP
jgi:phage terminase Nu1 subunit (DNA packaging protein)